MKILIAGAGLGGLFTRLLGVGHDPGDVGLLVLVWGLGKGQGRQEHLLQLPLLQTGLGGDFEDGGDRGHQIHFACVPEGRRTV